MALPKKNSLQPYNHEIPVYIKVSSFPNNKTFLFTGLKYKTRFFRDIQFIFQYSVLKIAFLCISLSITFS